MAKDFNNDERRKVKRLICKYCANYFNGTCCFLDDGDNCPCIQLISNHLMCNYFKKAVLPLDAVLERALLGYTSKEVCALCKKPILITGNKKKYCKECAKLRLQIQKAEYQRKHRKKVEK